MAEKLKVTNSKQFERLVHLMQNHPDIARGTRTFGSSKQLVEEKWDSFAAELNSFGPPHRTGKEWQRVWINYKAKTKKKLSVNSANLRATGGGPSQELTLSALEQSVSELLHTQEVVNPSGSHFGTVQVLELQPSGSVAQNVNVDSVATSPSHTVTPSVRAAIKKKTRKTLEEKKVDMLQSQTQNNKQLTECLKKVEKSIYKLARYTEKCYNLKKENLELVKQKLILDIELKKKKMQMLD